jgi:thiol-disulfide isomerase/thioredoxin
MTLSGRLGAHLRSRWRSYVGNVLLFVVVLAGVQFWQTRHVPAGPAPDLSVAVVNPLGEVTTTTLAQWRARHPNQPLALHFWADWCPICRAEQGSISSLSQDWPVLTVAMQSGDASKVAAVMRERELPWNAAVDPRGDIARAYGIQAVPGFVVVDRHGQIRVPSAGYTTEWGMRARLWWVKLSG